MPLAPSFIDDKNQQNIPVVVIIGNLTKSTNDSVSLLKHTEGMIEKYYIILINNCFYFNIYFILLY